MGDRTPDPYLLGVAEAEIDLADAQPVSFGELARWRDRALAAEAELRACNDQWGMLNDRLGEAKAERGRARAEVERLRVCTEETEAMCERLRCERDEARALLDAAYRRAERAESHVDRLCKVERRDRMREEVERLTRENDNLRRVIGERASRDADEAVRLLAPMARMRAVVEALRAEDPPNTWAGSGCRGVEERLRSAAGLPGGDRHAQAVIDALDALDEGGAS